MSVTGHRENVRLWVPVLTISESVVNRSVVARIRYESIVNIESGLYCHSMIRFRVVLAVLGTWSKINA